MHCGPTVFHTVSVFIVQVITVYDNSIGCEENHHGIQDIKSDSDCEVYTLPAVL